MRHNCCMKAIEWAWTYFPLGQISLPLKSHQNRRLYANCYSKGLGMITVCLVSAYMLGNLSEIGTLMQVKSAYNKYIPNKNLVKKYGKIKNSYELREGRLNETDMEPRLPCYVRLESMTSDFCDRYN